MCAVIKFCKACIKPISEIIFLTLSDCVTWFNFSKCHLSLLRTRIARHYANEYAHELYGIGRIHLPCVGFLSSCNVTADIFGTFCRS